MFVVPHPGVRHVDEIDIIVRPELEKAAPFLKQQALSHGSKVGPDTVYQQSHLDVALATKVSPVAKP